MSSTGPARLGPARDFGCSPVRPRLGVLDFHPIQYHVPLYEHLTVRGRVQLDVLYLRDHGLAPVVDAGFGVPVAWDIDLLSGYRHEFLAGSPLQRASRLTRWLRDHDAVVIHGHSDPWMLAAVAVCRAAGVRYLLRGDSGPRGQSGGLRGGIRYGVARAVVGGSAGGLAVGQRNEQFYTAYRAPRTVFAPHSVDNDRFAATPPVSRADLLERWGLDPAQPVVMFCGKLRDAKRPLDLAAAVARLTEPVSVLFVGDGPLAGAVRYRLTPGRGAVTGFVNQAELPAYYHAADILVLPSQAEPWGLVVNEAMCAGVLPVVSDRVGCGPDLVAGLGEIYPCGDVAALATALSRALGRYGDPAVGREMRRRVARYGIGVTAAGFEQATLAVTAR
ncbi:MAG TPA: glycosyltransferase family 4 protein [Streptosporangiaceae bacterium]